MTFAEVANIAVMASFGLLAGVLIQVQRVLDGGATDRKSPRRSGESFIATAMRYAEEGRAAAATGPRSLLVVNLAVFGVIAVMVLSLLLSPLEMQWLVFLAGVFGGFLIAGWLLLLAKRQRIRPRGQGLFDVLPENAPPSDRITPTP